MILEPESCDDHDTVSDSKSKKSKKRTTTDVSKSTVPSDSSSLKYDPHKRAPQYSNADKTCLWELVSRTFYLFLLLPLFELPPLINASLFLFYSFTVPVHRPLSSICISICNTTFRRNSKYCRAGSSTSHAITFLGEIRLPQS